MSDISIAGLACNAHLAEVAARELKEGALADIYRCKTNESNKETARRCSICKKIAHWYIHGAC